MKKFITLILAAVFATGVATAQNSTGEKKVLVAYFSATGTTEGVAKKLASALRQAQGDGAIDLYEIVPEQKYTATDLDWNDKKSRTSIECADENSLPAIAGQLPDFSKYDTIFVGFPIWWYKEPHIIRTFLKDANLSGKKIVPFCTSGGSGIGGAIPGIKKYAPGAKVSNGRRFRSSDSEKTIADWAKKEM